MFGSGKMGGDGLDDIPIDLVYTWVDGSDPAWLDKKDEFFGEYSKERKNGGGARYSNMDELKYSLRSVHKYAPWINKIYVVVDDVQAPAFIDPTHPKIQIVKHSEIMDPKYLPTYNSAPIEASIHHIPGLSENFIYSNDDMFFGNSITKQDLYNRVYWHHMDDSFFTPHEINPKDQEWVCSIKNGYWIVKDKYPDAQMIICPHVANICKKSLMYEIEREFPDIYERTMNQKLRKHTNDPVCNTVYLHKMQCILGVCKGIYTVTPTDAKLYSYYEMSKQRDVNKLHNIIDKPAKFFCINNITGFSEEVDAVLSLKFPAKPPYEI